MAASVVALLFMNHPAKKTNPESSTEVPISNCNHCKNAGPQLTWRGIFCEKMSTSLWTSLKFGLVEKRAITNTILE